MPQEEPYDRWHKSRPKPGEPECPDHEGKVASAHHGCESRWMARWRDADDNQQTQCFPENRKMAALKFQRSQRAAVAEGRDPFPTPRGRQSAKKKEPETAPIEGPTIAEYVETFLARHEGRPGTVDTYGFRLRGHVVPKFGGRAVSSVKRGEYREFFTALKKQGMPDSTRSGIKKSLSALLSMAVEDELLEGNPVVGIRLPKGGGKDVQLTWQHVVAIADHIPPRFRLMVWYGSLQALRSMEAAGVRDCDMDAVPGRQLVQEQRQRGKAVPLKTDASKAPLAVGSFLREEYEEHLAHWRRPLTEVELGKRKRRNLRPLQEQYADLVTLTRYFTPVREESLCRAFNSAKERARAAGIDVPANATFRDLRHFADAVLIASGLEPRKVQARMRHARIAETLDTYGYLVWEVDWQNAPASFTEMYGIPAPAGLPQTALTPRAERLKSQFRCHSNGVAGV
jgi:integrase